MPSRRVCRLEHKDSGLGPFEHRLARNRQSDMVVKLPFHREPEEYPEFHEWLRHKELTKAFKLGQVSPVRFAWPDETTMRWFLARVPARRYGHWVVQVYEVHDYILLPDGQVAFDRRSAVKHTTTPLPAFNFFRLFVHCVAPPFTGKLDIMGVSEYGTWMIRK